MAVGMVTWLSSPPSKVIDEGCHSLLKGGAVSEVAKNGLLFLS